jgi:hypothetical protein
MREKSGFNQKTVRKKTKAGLFIKKPDEEIAEMKYNFITF